MIEKITRINNPLTIIAIFAALAEIASSIALVALPENTQSVFVWFCMIFPTLLVLSFFIVLYRKPKVLYAPSDFKDEKNFISILDEKYLNIEKKIEASSEYTLKNFSTNFRLQTEPQYQFGASPKELLEQASNEENSGKAARLLTQLLVNADTTAIELEVAGDLARKSGRRSLARDLYKLSTEKDSSRPSAQIEYLAIKAEMEVSERSEIFKQLKQIALNNLSRNNFARVANSFIEFDLYDDLKEFSEEVIKHEDINPTIKSLAYRNLGTAYQVTGQNDKAIENFENALNVGVDLENVMRPYVRLLMDLGKNDDILKIARKLVEKDATNSAFHRFLIEALIRSGREDEANEHLERTKNLGLSI